jgi:hypothetical protein
MEESLSRMSVAVGIHSVSYLSGDVYNGWYSGTAKMNPGLNGKAS